MLLHPTLDKLEQMRLHGMARALRDQLTQPEMEQLPFMDRLGLLVDHEEIVRYNNRLRSRLRRARLRQEASMADLDYRRGRNLDRRLMASLSTCDWVGKHHNAIITGPTGVGKSFVACALAHKACMEGFTVRYHRLHRLLEDLQLAHGGGRFLKLLKQLTRFHLLVLDDWGLSRISALHQRDLLELIDDRYQKGSIVVTSQMPVSVWHEGMEDPTLADAILDRLIHNAHHIALKGESMRQRLPKWQNLPEKTSVTDARQP